MKTRYFLYGVLILGLTGCDSGRPAEETAQPGRPVPVVPALPADTSSAVARRLTPPPPLSVDTLVADAWAQLQRALRQHNAAQLNQLIAPETGLWLVEQPGATLTITRVAAGTAFRRAYLHSPLAELAPRLVPCALLQAVAQLPEVDCGEQTNGRSGFARDGCFAGPATAFQEMDLWPAAVVKGGTVAQGRAAQQSIGRTVLHTRTGFRFHFARVPGTGGRWRLVFIDLRSPCIS
jgi:hypothetical protein